MYYMLLYDYVDDVLERRPAYRDAHLKLLTDLHERGDSADRRCMGRSC